MNDETGVCFNFRVLTKMAQVYKNDLTWDDWQLSDDEWKGQEIGNSQDSQGGRACRVTISRLNCLVMQEQHLNPTLIQELD